MRRPLLALLALLPASVVTSAPASTGAFPSGSVVVRPECFGSVDGELRAVGGSVGGVVGGTVGGPPATPSPSAVASGRGSGKGGGPARKPKKKSPKAPMSQAAPEDDYDYGAADSIMEESAAEMTMPPPPPEPEPEPEAEKRDMEGGEDIADYTDELSRAERRPGPVLDWGATVYLSNDDSMSLASAQRLLYAVTNGRRFSPSEVRPHELLNYFSFDTSTPTAAQTFDVLASAEQDGDTLSVALAVKGAVPARQPLDLTLIVDRSCSMEDEGRMDYTKRGLTQMTDQLERGDRIDLVLFDDAICTPLENYVVGRDDPSLLTDTIARMQPLGATDVDLGLREGYAVASKKRDTHRRNRRMMILTDAMMNTGDVNPNTVSEIAKAYEDEGIRLTGIGVGSEFNDEVLNKLTEKGKGAYVFLGSEAVVDRVFGVGFDSLTTTIAHDVKFALKLPKSLAMERFYGEESSTVASDVQPIHYYAGTSQVFLQDLRLKNRSPVRGDPVVLEISYRDAATGEPEKRTFKTTVGKMLDSDPHNVRKARSLMAWTDLLLEQSMGGTPCGEPMRVYGARASGVTDDAEIGFVNGLVGQTCPSFSLPAYVERGGPAVSYKVKVDSDIPIAEVAMSCGRSAYSEALSGSDTVARFQVSPGACTVTLSGVVGMTTEVEVPSTGGDLRCIVRGGRMSCS